MRPAKWSQGLISAHLHLTPLRGPLSCTVAAMTQIQTPRGSKPCTAGLVKRGARKSGIATGKSLSPPVAQRLRLGVDFWLPTYSPHPTPEPRGQVVFWVAMASIPSLLLSALICFATGNLLPGQVESVEVHFERSSSAQAVTSGECVRRCVSSSALSSSS